jgi:hypothetical protein
MERGKGDPEKIAKLCKQLLKIHFGNTVWWPNVISNEDLCDRTKQKETWKEIRYQKWKWIGHILTQDNESIAKKAFECNLQEGRRKGRPRIT